MAVGVYVRVSTEEQRERQSIATQREFAVRYCELHQLAVHEVYADDGVSGTVPLEMRAGGIRLLEDARRAKFDQLLVFKLDRLGRDTRLILNNVAELEKHGVRVRSMTEEFDTATATGRLMLTMLSGFAAHERELIRERSVAGTNRLAEAGAWLGGVVPYGYRKQGARGQGRLAVDEEPIPGLEISASEVVRRIYRLCTQEKKSCQKIAGDLNCAGIPCGSAETAEPGKRRRRTAAFWRASHVRNIIASRTYMGEHLFGKRSKNRNRKTIARAVPGIVSDETWTSAQRVLRSNRIMSPRNARHLYLLRGLIKCGHCGLTFSGIGMTDSGRSYSYRCNGRQRPRELHGAAGAKCPAKGLNGEYVERLVWADIESFLRHPGEILERLRERFLIRGDERGRCQKKIDELVRQLQQKAIERDRVLGLFRRGRIDEAVLDQQMDAIQNEAAGLDLEIQNTTGTLAAADRQEQFRSAESLLEQLRARLDGPIPQPLRRRIVEILVARIEACTVERDGVQESEISITYRFSQPDEPAPLVLPRSHRLSSRTRVPEECLSVGDHLRRRRVASRLLQKQVADRLGVDKTSVYNWENNRTTPAFEYMPAIIRFLGYDPQPPARDWGDRLTQCRKAAGLSQKEAARQMQVDPSTLARWERGQRQPAGEYETRALGFLADAGAQCSVEMGRTA